MTTIPPNPEEALVTISTPTSDTVRIRDRVESSRFEFYFDDDVEIEEASTDTIYFPVDVAAHFCGNWEEITVPILTGIVVRDKQTGQVVGSSTEETDVLDLPQGDYNLDIMSPPMKTYLHVEGALTITRNPESISLQVDASASATLGTRSVHDRPAGTIQTTGEIEDVMQAVSHLSSSLKTTSPERSWPTLRGYPPRIEIGDSFDVPSSISRPDVDVRLEIPPTLEAVFQTTPLAYYTAAEVVVKDPVASSPGLVVAGKRIPLDGALGEAASELLERIFMLDCVVRTEGLYPFDIEERNAIKEALPWDIETIYDAEIGDRIAAYDEVPSAAVDRIRPTWHMTMDVVAVADAVPTLPHIAEELAVVRIPGTSTKPLRPQPDYLREFARSDGGFVQKGIDRAINGNGSDRGSVTEFHQQVSSPSEWSTQLHTSMCEGYPLGSSKMTNRAYEQNIGRTAPESETIEVDVICNDEEMREEDIVTEFYGVRDLLEFKVNVYYNLSKAELADLLQQPTDLIHYIGHVDEEGILCSDGYLDVRTDLNDVGVKTFLLNACSSVEQGEALLDSGSVGGIATLFDVPNSSATKLGRALSRLLNRGFTLRAAIEIARETSVLGRRWISLGNGRLSLTQAESGVPNVMNIEYDDGTFHLELEYFETESYRIGSIVRPMTDWGTYQVLPNTSTIELTEDQLDDFFSLEVVPVRFNGALYWTDEISPAELKSEI